MDLPGPIRPDRGRVIAYSSVSLRQDAPGGFARAQGEGQPTRESADALKGSGAFGYIIEL